MRYVDVRRPGGVESFWLRLRLAFAGPRSSRPTQAVVREVSHLDDHLLRDIGLLPREWPRSWRDLV